MKKAQRVLAALWLSLVLFVAGAAQIVARQSPTQISLDLPDSPPSRTHLLGTDAVSRDRFSRLLYGTRVSVLLAPLAAALATAAACAFGVCSGLSSKKVDALLMFGCELFLALPWMFLLIAVRSVLPLNASPTASAVITFFLLGCLGWAGAARIIAARTREWVGSDQYLFARALGMPRWRTVLIHLPVVLKPILIAQFWIAVPVFMVAEANLSLIGLGIADPLPSWGALMRECERPDVVLSAPWVLAPLLVLVATITATQILLRGKRISFHV